MVLEMQISDALEEGDLVKHAEYLCKYYEFTSNIRQEALSRETDRIYGTEKRKTMCLTCNVLLTVDSKTSTMICGVCGVVKETDISGETLRTNNITYKQRNHYNHKPVHRFTPAEHFIRYLSDVTGTSQRNIPVSLYHHFINKYKGKTVTPELLAVDISKMGKPLIQQSQKSVA